jgi:FtsZ-binding cell division protein ZapB
MIQRELSQQRKAGRSQANLINETVDAGIRGSSHSPLRSALKNTTGPVKRDLSESFSRTGTDKIEQLQRQLIELQTENERLKHDASLMVGNYNRKLEALEDTNKTLGQRVDQSESMRNPDYEEMLARENEALKKETSMLRDKVANLSRDVD